MGARRRMLLGSVATVLGFGAVYFSFPGQTTGEPTSSGSTTAGAARPASASRALTASPVSPSSGAPNEAPPAQAEARKELPGELEQLSTYLRGRYGEKLKEPYVQIKMLEELMRYFQKRSPDRWQEELLAFLKQEFPEMYDELASMLRNRMDYEKWVKDNDAYLRGLSPQERRAAMWDARTRLFGKEAAERIWASELKNQALADTLAALDAKQDANLRQKLSAYKQRIQEIYGEQAQAQIARHQQEMMDRFLTLSSVQQELSELPPELRSQNLRAIRQEMGLDEEALKRWDALDQTRDVRWEAGARYMAERQSLAKQFSGAELEAKLQEVRARYFGTEADLIAHEEASGFFRFERPRQWGRN